MKTIKYFFIIITISAFSIFSGVILFSLPASLTLPSGIRSGIEELSIDDAVKKLKNSELSGFDLVEETRKLIITRMQYCRRNSFDSPEKAFYRGYGYCIQQAFAMEYILNRLGFNAKVVQSTKNKFHNGEIGGHAWVRVEYKGAVKDLDPTHVDLNSDKLTFVPLNEITEMSGIFKYIALWGSTSVNAYRYYSTGRDF